MNNPNQPYPQAQESECSYFDRAKITLNGIWCLCAFSIFLFLLFPSTLDAFLFSGQYRLFGTLFDIIGMIGYSTFFLNITKGKPLIIKDLLIGLTNFRLFCQSACLYFLIVLGIVIGFLLFVVPGVIFSLMFSQSFFILAENPEINCIEAMKRSNRMM